MAHLTLVVAVDARNGIGVDNQLPWHLPEDLAHFKRVTLGKPIIMGRKTFDSIGRPLPKRRNIVVTRNAAWSHEGVETAPSLEAAVALLAGEPASIIGGAQIFEQTRPLADRIYLTRVHLEVEGDTFWTDLDPARWTEVKSRHYKAAEGDEADYTMIVYDRIRT